MDEGVGFVGEDLRLIQPARGVCSHLAGLYTTGAAISSRLAMTIIQLMLSGF